MGQPTFQIFSGRDGQFYFRLRAANSEIIFQSEGYTTKDKCKNGIASVKENAPSDQRYDRKDSVDGKFYFVLKAANQEPLGKSQVYSSAAAREKGIESVKVNAPLAKIEDLI